MSFNPFEQASYESEDEGNEDPVENPVADEQAVEAESIELENSDVTEASVDSKPESVNEEGRILTGNRKFDPDFFRENRRQLATVGGEGMRNIGLYRFEDRFIKVVKKGRGITPEGVEILQSKVSDLPNVVVPESVIALDDGSTAIILPIAEGTPGDALTPEMIEAIPQEQWQVFEDTIKTLSDRGVMTDLTKRSNFFYDAGRGFIFIDIQEVTADGSSTGKFIDRDGEQLYYPFERFRVLPKKYQGPKALFLAIQ